MAHEPSKNGYLVGSNLEKILKAGHFAVTGELGPPQSADSSVIREKASFLKGFVRCGQHYRQPDGHCTNVEYRGWSNFGGRRVGADYPDDGQGSKPPGYPK